MRISLSSNVVSAVYIVIFDLLLTLFLTCVVRLFLSSWNIKRMYEDRKALYLESSKLSLVIHQDLTSRRIGGITAALSTVVVALAIAGSFSINGVSRPGVRARTVPILIDAVSPSNHLNFTEHVSQDGLRVSGFFLLIRSALRCKTSRNTGDEFFAAFNSLDDAGSIKWSSELELTNSTCVTENEGYENRISFREVRVKELPNPIGCKLTVDGNNFDNPTKVDGKLNDDCPFRADETWCSTHQTTFCAGSVSVGNLSSTMVMEKAISPSVPSDALFVNGDVVFDASFLGARPDTRTLISMSFLLSTRAEGLLSRAREMAMLTVYKDAEVLELSGTVNETEVNGALIIATTGLAVLLSIGFGLVAWKSWYTYVKKPGRKQYNFFHSVDDMLSCALSEVSNDGTCRFRTTGGAILSLKEGVPLLERPGTEAVDDRPM